MTGQSSLSLSVIVNQSKKKFLTLLALRIENKCWKLRYRTKLSCLRGGVAYCVHLRVSSQARQAEEQSRGSLSRGGSHSHQEFFSVYVNKDLPFLCWILLLISPPSPSSLQADSPPTPYVVVDLTCVILTLAVHALPPPLPLPFFLGITHKHTPNQFC